MRTLWGAIVEVTGGAITFAMITACVFGPPEIIERRRRVKRARAARARQAARTSYWEVHR